MTGGKISNLTLERMLQLFLKISPLIKKIKILMLKEVFKNSTYKKL